MKNRKRKIWFSMWYLWEFSSPVTLKEVQHNLTVQIPNPSPHSIKLCTCDPQLGKSVQGKIEDINQMLNTFSLTGRIRGF